MADSTAITRRTAIAGLATLSTASALSISSNSLAQNRPRPAPQWEVVEWFNGDGGNVDTLRGKVVVIDFFQLWCPGCNSFSGPLMSHWQKEFASEINTGSLHMVKIHTVFEGHNYQTVQRLKAYIKKKGITLPVGVDRHQEGRHVPITMGRYRTSGTPEMVIIDKRGMIRFQHFGYFDPKKVEPALVALMKRSAA
ncbi:MAG: TlpA family protein disulfide reductase [Hyphomicrobiaceae bacterium]